MIFKGITLVCPSCKGELTHLESWLDCAACDRQYPIIAGIPDLRVFPDPYLGFDADREKALKLAGKADGLDFQGMVHYYYANTQVVPAQHAILYSRGLLSAGERARVTLDGWLNQAGLDGNPGCSILEIGCGTAPLLAAASVNFDRVVGIDIALRWLILGRKRLDELGLDLPLLCACAEALPFPDSSYRYVVSESTLEHLKDQPRALQEAIRVLEEPGFFFATTPNRYSLGPDPQTGIIAGAYLPNRLTAFLVEKQGGIPPKRHLLSGRQLKVLMITAGFEDPSISLPEISHGQQSQFSGLMGRVISVYNRLRTTSLGRWLLLVIGPLLSVVARKYATNTGSDAALG
jgi:SAM-dependent methyltransferase/uncharacterized protein YbaR (Trm112 family)